MLKRIGIYLNEMFPIGSMFGTVLMAIAVELAYLGLYDFRPSFSLKLISPGVVITLVSLLIRIMDEFKDYKDDLINFPNRPLPSGKVKKEDLKALGIFCVIAILFLSTASLRLFFWALLTLGFTGLMLKWFFMEALMRKSLPLAFATHHPIVLFNFIYLIIACHEIYPAAGYEKSIYVLPLCLMFTNWEISRKIRSPEQETAYTTYSKIWGPRVAAAISFFLQLGFIICMMYIFKGLHSPSVLGYIFLSVQLFLVLPLLKFFITLKLRKNLKQNAEAQIFSVILFLLIAALI